MQSHSNPHSSQPKVSLRFLASYYTLAKLVVLFLCLWMLLGFGPTGIVVTLVIMVMLYGILGGAVYTLRLDPQAHERIDWWSTPWMTLYSIWIGSSAMPVSWGLHKLCDIVALWRWNALRVQVWGLSRHHLKVCLQRNICHKQFTIRSMHIVAQNALQLHEWGISQRHFKVYLQKQKCMQVIWSLEWLSQVILYPNQKPSSNPHQTLIIPDSMMYCWVWGKLLPEICFLSSNFVYKFLQQKEFLCFNCSLEWSNSEL